MYSLKFWYMFTIYFGYIPPLQVSLTSLETHQIVSLQTLCPLLHSFIILIIISPLSQVNFIWEMAMEIFTGMYHYLQTKVTLPLLLAIKCYNFSVRGAVLGAPLPPMLEFWMALFCVGLVQATMTAVSCPEDSISHLLPNFLHLTNSLSTLSSSVFPELWLEVGWGYRRFIHRWVSTQWPFFCY